MKYFFSPLIILALLCASCDTSSETREAADPFKLSSGISSIPTDSQTVENLVVLGRVWGFLKYYHPVVASGKYNWDYELFKVMPGIIDAQTADIRNSLLESWIDSLGTFEQQDSIPIVDSADVKLWPDYSWINNSVLGTELSDKLKQIITAKRAEKNYYVSIANGIGNPIFKNEDAYDSLQFPDAGYRILCLYRYWNMIEYFYPNKHLVGRDWAGVLPEYIVRFIETESEIDYEFCVMRMTAEIHDTHAYLSGDINAYLDLRGRYIVPARVSFIENKPVVLGYYDEATEKSCVLKCGDIIIALDNVSVDSILAQRQQFLCASNEPTALRNFASGLLRSQDSILQVTVERNGNIISLDAKCVVRSSYKKDLYYECDTSIYTAAPGIMCLFAGLAKQEELAKSYQEISVAKGLIIDFRNYPSDWLLDTICNMLYPTRQPFVKFTMSSNTMPGLFTFTECLPSGRSNPLYYKGKVVIIVNEETQSSAEYHAMAFRAAPNAIVLGSTTAGADGNVSTIKLPGGLETMISGIGILYPDGSETQRVGIVPDVEVHPTIKGIREGRDELMEKAIEIVSR